MRSTRFSRTDDGRPAGPHRGRPRVLLVTGAYFPEISSGGVQCRSVARALGNRVHFSVLTTAVDTSLPREEVVDGIPVHRLPIDVGRRRSTGAAAFSLAATFGRIQRHIDIVHVHGFSRKNVPVTMLARLFRKPLIVSLHTAGQDDPASVRARGPVAYWAYRHADRFLSVSPQLTAQYSESGLPLSKLEEVPNGVDTTRFRPSDDRERAALRQELGLPRRGRIVLFVGFFSRDKRPDVLFNAWMQVLRRTAEPVTLVCVGATSSTYFEIDPALADNMREDARKAGVSDWLVLVEPTNEIDKYFRSADLFALPSAREAMPMALVEAMACGLPCIASRLPLATDVMIENGVNGVLVDEVDEWPAALESLVCDDKRLKVLGENARATALQRFSIERTAEGWLAAYEQVLGVAVRRGADLQVGPSSRA